MADDFRADELRELDKDLSFIRVLATWSFIIVVLLVMALVRKGVLSGWGDLVRDTAAAP